MICQNWFHVKSEWQKNAEIFTLWESKLYSKVEANFKSDLILDGPKPLPISNSYKFKVIPNNVTQTDVEVSAFLGGPFHVTGNFVGNVLMTYLHNIDNNEIDVVGSFEINPKSPKIMIYKLKDLTHDHEMIQYLERFVWKSLNKRAVAKNIGL